jgi:hypothetical protein
LRLRRSLALAVAAAVLFGLAWYLRHSLPGWTSSAPGRGESPTSGLKAPSTTAGEIPRPEGGSAASIDPEHAKGDEVDRLVASVDWKSFGGAVLAFTQEQERARRERRAPNYDPETIEILARNNLQMQKLAKLLGVQDLRETRFHERVWPSYARGWMAAVGVDLSPAQDAELDQTARAFARSRAEEEKALQNPSRLEKLAWDAEKGLGWDEAARKFLTPDQYADYARPGGSDPFWGRQASRLEVSANGVEASADGVEAFWQSTLGVDESLLPIVKGAATDYVREVERQIAGFRARYPGEAPRDEEIRLRIALLRLQTGAEKGLVERLGVPLEQRQGLAQGSGTVLDWRGK